MTYQKKIVLLYIIAATFVIVANYGAHAQEVIPDSKLKTNVSSLNNALDYVVQLQPKRFQYNTTQFQHLQLPAGGSYGFISEEFRQVMPHLVTNEVKFYNTGKNSQRTAIIPSVDMEKLVPVLVGAIQEQQVMIQQLQEELAALKKNMAP